MMIAQGVNQHRLIRDFLDRHPNLSGCQEPIETTFAVLCEVFQGGGKLLVCGNGGSSADSAHIVGELMKGFVLKRPIQEEHKEALNKAFGSEGRALSEHLQRGLPTIDLTSQTALMTAYCNDVHPDFVFAQQVYVYGQPSDALLAISTSGNSRNVIAALQVAKIKGLKTILLTSPNGGRGSTIADITINAPGETVYEIQENHLPIYHLLCLMLEKRFFDSVVDHSTNSQA